MVSNPLAKESKREINYTFKVLYAIGIFFVVCGHAQADDFIFWNELIHAAGFHMGLFIFASGYFYSIKNNDAPLAYTIKKVKRLLIPYLLWNCFYAIVITVLYQFGFKIGNPVNLKNLIIDPLIDGPKYLFNLPSWFVCPLFFTELINVWLRAALKKFAGKKLDITLFIITLLLGFAGIHFAGDESGISGVRLFITRLMYFLPFYNLGFIYKNYLEKKDTLSSFWYFLIIILIELLYILVYGSSPCYSIVGMFHFDNPILVYIMGTVGIAFWLRVSKIMAPAIGKSKYLNLVADNTFTIMINHGFGFFVLNGLFYIALSVIGQASKFDLESYKTMVHYIFLPRGRGFPLVFVVFGIVFSLLMQKIVLLVKSWFLQKIQNRGVNNGR